MKIFVGLLYPILLFSLVATAHSGRTNNEGCHKNTHNDVFHCHRGKGRVLPLPEKARYSAKKTRRSVASVKKSLSKDQFELLRYQCCTGQSYLSEKTCQSFGFKNWSLQKKCSQAPLKKFKKTKLHRHIQCFQCCVGESHWSQKACSEKGFKNWKKGSKCGC